MYNANKTQTVVHPSINALALLGTRAMKVIDRQKSIAAIGVYERTLGPKVGHFMEARIELKKLALAYKELAAQGAAEVSGLDAEIRAWGATLRLGPSHDFEDIGITEARTPESILDSAQTMMEMLRGRDEPLVAEALNAIEVQYSTALPAFDAAQAGRVAVQAKQRELQAVDADVHEELVRLRKVVRRMLGWSHLDYQRLRLRIARQGTDVDDEGPPATPASSPATDPGSQPSAVT
jgi:hypothetical protein